MADCASVVVVPGIGGSTLEWNGVRLWADSMTPFRSFRSLMLPQPAQAVEILDRIVVLGPFEKTFYQPLLKFLRGDLGLEDDADLFPFPYDWRQDCRTTGGLLSDRIKSVASDRPGKPIVILAHSMGGLLAQWAVEYGGCRPLVSAEVTMGTPHLGSPVAFEVLINGVALLPGGWRREETLDAFRSFPSAYQLLPAQPNDILRYDNIAVDAFDRTDWLPGPHHQALRDARRFNNELAACPPSGVYHAVVGYEQKTLSCIRIPVSGPNIWKRATFEKRNVGDGTVPSTSAESMSPPLQRHLVRRKHHDLFDYADVREWLRGVICPNARAPITAPPQGEPPPYLATELLADVVRPNESVVVTVELYGAGDGSQASPYVRAEIVTEEGEVIDSNTEKLYADGSGNAPAAELRVKAPESPGGFMIRTVAEAAPDVVTDLALVTDEPAAE